MPEPDSDIFLVGSYGTADAPRIHAVSLDASGAMRQLGGFAGIANPSFLALHPDGRTLYAVSETGVRTDGVAGHVHALRFRHTSASVDFELMGTQATHGDHPCHLSLDQTGRWLFATNYSSGEVVVFPVGEDGILSEAVGYVRHAGRGAHADRQRGPHPHSTTAAPDNQYLIVADLGLDEVIVYSRDEDTGLLDRHSGVRTQAGAGPRMVAFHPSGRFLCVVNELNSTLAMYVWDARRGILDEIQIVSTLPDRVDTQNLAADVCFDSSGSIVYVSNRGRDSVVVHRFDNQRGLTMMGSVPSGGGSPRSMAVAPRGDRLLVANEQSDRIAAVPLDEFVPIWDASSASLDIEHPSFVISASSLGRLE